MSKTGGGTSETIGDIVWPATTIVGDQSIPCWMALRCWVTGLVGGRWTTAALASRDTTGPDNESETILRVPRQMIVWGTVADSVATLVNYEYCRVVMGGIGLRPG